MKEISFGAIENTAIVPIEEYAELVVHKNNMEMLMAYLQNKRKHYGGMKHEEVEMICAMFNKEVEE